MDTCIFCQIISGNEPATVQYEDEYYMAFEPLRPVAKGHVLLVPRTCAATITDMNEESLSALGASMNAASKHVQESNNATGLNILQANGKDAQQSVRHVHFHLVPRYKDDGLDLWIKQSL